MGTILTILAGFGGGVLIGMVLVFAMIMAFVKSSRSW